VADTPNSYSGPCSLGGSGSPGAEQPGQGSARRATQLGPSWYPQVRDRGCEGQRARPLRPPLIREAVACRVRETVRRRESS
jgi:hypothetical protein